MFILHNTLTDIVTAYVALLLRTYSSVPLEFDRVWWQRNNTCWFFSYRENMRELNNPRWSIQEWWLPCDPSPAFVKCLLTSVKPEESQCNMHEAFDVPSVFSCPANFFVRLYTFLTKIFLRYDAAGFTLLATKLLLLPKMLGCGKFFFTLGI